MNFSDEEKHFVLFMAFSEYREIIKEKYGDDGLAQFTDLAFSSVSKDEWDKLIELKNTLFPCYIRRRFELERFVGVQGDEEPDFIDVKHVPLRTLQLGLFLIWKSAHISKLEDEEEEDFQKRKDWHDYLLGYVNHEAIIDPLIKLKEINAEYDKQAEIIQNCLSILTRNMNK